MGATRKSQMPGKQEFSGLNVDDISRNTSQRGNNCTELRMGPPTHLKTINPELLLSKGNEGGKNESETIGK